MASTGSLHVPHSRAAVKPTFKGSAVLQLSAGNPGFRLWRPEVLLDSALILSDRQATLDARFVNAIFYSEPIETRSFTSGRPWRKTVIYEKQNPTLSAIFLLCSRH